MKKYWMVLIGLLVAGNCLAQKDKAAETYNDLGYKASIPLFEKKDTLSTSDIIKIANSYRLNHDVINAEIWYAQVIKRSSDPIHYLHYAQALHSNKKYDLAKEYYLKYQEKMGAGVFDQRGAKRAAAIDKINDFRHSDILIKNEKAINTVQLEFSPAFYQDGIVFVSTIDPKQRQKTKKVKEANEELDLWINDHFMTLYYAAKTEDNELGAPEVFSSNISTKFHEGPVTFSPSGDQIFFCRNHYNNGKKKTDKKGILKMSIYSATRMGGDWVNVKELEFNTKDYEEVHPTLSPDGRTLYFSSDRPGGLGGMDIYQSQFIDGKWSEPFNAGKEINTPGNEIFPFIHSDGILYFASDGWGGLGGLDIFSVVRKDNNSWEVPVNLGTPFNSSKDDFGFILNDTGTEGYFSSAREGGQGKDDIYSFNVDHKEQLEGHSNNYSVLEICVYDKHTGEPIEGVEIDIQAQKAGITQETTEDQLLMRLVETGKENEYLLQLSKRTSNLEKITVMTDKLGEATTQLNPNARYLLAARKNGYTVLEYPYTTPGSPGKITLSPCLVLEKGNCQELLGEAVNEKYGNAIPNVKITLINLCTGDLQETFTDAKGQYNFPCLPCGCGFLVMGSKLRFFPTEKKIATIEEHCATDGPLIANLFFVPGELDATVPPINKSLSTNNYSSPNPPLSGTPVDLKVGNTIELKNIYYNFDQYQLRQGAVQSLDWVVELMNQYPSLVIELSAHTDSRGSSTYNQWLSRKRAESAMAYVVRRGIPSNRLRARGYGENLLRNHCSDDSDCSEAEHQYNRRTEVRVIAFDRKDVPIHYLNNDPEVIDYAPAGIRQ